MAKYKSLYALVTAIQKGEEPEDTEITVDNDSIYAYGPSEDEDELGEKLFNGDGPTCELINLLEALGIQADEP
jgi:hypothetical protein